MPESDAGSVGTHRLDQRECAVDSLASGHPSTGRAWPARLQRQAACDNRRCCHGKVTRVLSAAFVLILWAVVFCFWVARGVHKLMNHLDVPLCNQAGCGVGWGGGW